MKKITFTKKDFVLRREYDFLIQTNNRLGFIGFTLCISNLILIYLLTK